MIVGDDAGWGEAPKPPDAFTPSRDVIAFDQLLDAPLPTRWPAVEPDDIALLQYTGATTGLPKAAILTHANLTAAGLDLSRMGFGSYTRPGAAPDRVIMVLPAVSYLRAVQRDAAGISRAATVSPLRARFDVETVLHDIEVERATSFPGVPTMWIALINHPGIETCDFSSLRVIGSGGAPLPIEVAARVKRVVGLPLPSGWGMTETSPAGISPPANGLPKPGTIGIPLPGITVEVVALDDPRRVLGTRRNLGELQHQGAPTLVQAYWDRPRETARFVMNKRLLSHRATSATSTRTAISSWSSARTT